MNKWLKRALFVVVGIALLGVAVVSLGAWLGDRKAQRQLQVTVSAVALPDDAAGLARGR